MSSSAGPSRPPRRCPGRPPAPSDWPAPRRRCPRRCTWPRAQHGHRRGERAHEVHVVLDDDDGAFARRCGATGFRSPRVPRGSCPATGSSSSSTSAFCTSSMPISSHCFCPCASMPAGLSAQVGQPDRLQGLLDRRAARRTGAAAASTRERPAPAAMSRFCSTVSSSKTLAVWNVRPTPSRAIWCTFLPSSSTPDLLDRPGGRHQSGDRVDHRGLAGAVGSDEEPQVTLEQRQVDVADGLEAVEVDGQAADFEVLGAHADVAAGDGSSGSGSVGHDGGTHLLELGVGIGGQARVRVRHRLCARRRRRTARPARPGRRGRSRRPR